MLRHSPVIVTTLPDYGVFYLRSAHSERFRMALQRWPFRKIGWIEAGAGLLEFEDFELSYRQGDLFSIEAHKAHRFIDHKGTPTTLSMLCYDDRALVGHRTIQKQLTDSFGINNLISISDPWQQNNISEHFSRMLIEQNQQLPGFEALLQISVIELIILTMRLARQRNPNASSKEKMINGLTDYLKKNFNKEIVIDDLAEICSVSSRTLSRHFKDITGKTIIEYLTDLRLNYACQRIKETRQINFSAMDSGFNDISFFYRVFKKKFGKTPRQYMLENSY